MNSLDKRGSSWSDPLPYPRRPELQSKWNSYHSYSEHSKIRPLPKIPKSSTPVREISRPRLLPSPPQPKIPSSEVSAASILLPSLPPGPTPQSASHPPPSSQVRRSPPSSLSLHTSPEALKLPLRFSTDHPSSPLTPSVTPVLSPKTVRRKRFSKLRRHFGEIVPHDLILCGDHPMKKSGPDSPLCIKPPFLTPAFLDAESSSEDEEDADDHGVDANDTELEELEEHELEDKLPEDDCRWSFVQGATFTGISSNRYSTKWIRERGSRRWIENNHKDVLRALREL